MKNYNSVFVALFISMVALSLTGGKVTKHKEMECEEAKYIKRKGTAWEKRGRIVGEFKNPPDSLTIEYYSIREGKIVQTYTAPGKLYIYMSNYLPPGTYNVTFKSEGYHPKTLKKVKVMKETDCMIKINFGTRVFTNR